MLSETRLQTPLAGLHASYGLPLQHGTPERVQLSEKSLVTLANLRVDASSAAIASALNASLGLTLPTVPNTVAQGTDVMALWLGPDEWLLRTDAHDQGRLAARVEQALAGNWFAVTDQSSGYSVVQLHGPAARDVLSAGCPLDLHPRALRFGQCAQTHFFKAGILLRPLDAQGNGWEVIVRRSFADSAVRMLLDAMED